MSKKTAPSGQIHPVILSGGAGTRLWPLSRSLYPKQLLPLASRESLLQTTVRRVADSDRFAAPVLVCNDEHRFVIAEQLRSAEVTPKRILLEPEGRNTAPAVAAAAVVLSAEDPDALMLVMPSDHVIRDVSAFLDAVETASAAARAGALVTFGIAPTGPETGYGYILQVEPLDGVDGCFHVTRFVEKPDRATAESYLATGGYVWNSGMFLFAADTYLAELRKHDPRTAEACSRAVEAGREDLDFFRLDGPSFESATKISIDEAVMEKTDHAGVVPVDIGWSDIGTWSALWAIGESDVDGNVLKGDVFAEDVANSYLHSEKPIVAALGLDGIIVVATDDAVLVAAKDRAQDVKVLAERLTREGRSELHTHTRVYRPWGHYQTVDIGDRFQVKRLTVRPGGRLSLQRHEKRAEHWVVVSGTARVTRGDEVFDLGENQSTYIPLGTAHRLENPGDEPLDIVEVQSGSYLGEDDIIRLDDVYGRG